MSCYETHRGILHKVNTAPLSIKEWLINTAKNVNVDNDWLDFAISCEDKYKEQALHDLVCEINWKLDSKKPTYALLNDTLWEWETHECISDTIDICEVYPIKEGESYRIFTQFYNGGCCLNEILSDKFKTLEIK